MFTINPGKLIFFILLPALLLWGIFTSPASVAQEQELYDEKAVMEGIRSMLANPFSEKSRAAEKTVVDFSQGSDKVNVMVAKGLGYYPGSEWSDMLLAHYIAGVVKVQLEGAARDERAAVRAGLQAAIALYKKLKERDPALKIGSLETADARIKAGEMDLYVGEAMARAKEERR